MMHTAVEIRNLDIGYKQNKKYVLIHSGINLKAREGEVVTLIGVNGIGKSTLLKTMTRFLEPLHGQIFIQNKNITKYSRNSLARTVSFVSTEIVQVNNLKASEMVALGRHPYTNWFGNNTTEDKKAVQKSLEQVGACHLMDKFITELSDGERQRVMIARALAQDTPVIFLDEPTAFLDLPNKYEIFDLLVRLSRNENKTIILSSHDLHIALTEVDNVWLMDKENITEGAPEDLILNGQLDAFLKNSNVAFDQQEGMFKLKRQSNVEIKVQGEALQLAWTLKALERLGFRAADNAPYEIRCTQTEGFHWKLIHQQSKKSFGFDSIYDLNLHLKTKIKHYDNRT